MVGGDMLPLHVDSILEQGDLDQTTPFDPAEPEPIPDDDFDQSWSA